MSVILESLRPNERLISSLVLFLIGAAAATDIWSDSRTNTQIYHLIVEGLIASASLTGAIILSLGFRRAQRKVTQLETEVARVSEDALRWKEESGRHVEGLSRMIDEQLERWKLSPAEKEVALLLLKGLSHKEIAKIRNTSEASARQQAYAVYQKSGLTGRTDLSAFFLEDLLVPQK